MVLLFLTAVTDMLVIVLDNPVLALLLGVVFGESLIEQLVIDLSDVVFDNGDVVFCSGRVNIFTQELTVIVRQAMLLADTTADCSFSDRDCSFHIEFLGLVWYNVFNVLDIMNYDANFKKNKVFL